MSSRKTEVVIVGGSSGAILASTLSAARAQFDPARHNLTLITQLPFNVFLVASARMIVTAEGGLDATDKAFFPYDKLFKPGNAGRVLQGKVVNVLENPNVVELADGKQVPYDYLVLATGSKWTGPTSFDYTEERQVKDHIARWRKRIAAARSVVIVGGGAVGLEIATEIKHFHPATVVTVVHAGDKLINPTYPDKFRDRVKRRVEEAGVRVILGDRVLDIPDDGLSGENGKPVALRTANGTTIEADLFIPALGPKPNTGLLASLRNGTALTPSGSVRVTPSLNVQFGSGKSSGSVARNIFALGDIIDWPEQHMIAKAPGHIEVIKKNLLASLVQGAPITTPVAQYKGGIEGMFLTAGPKGGVGYLPFLWGIVLGNWIVSALKSGSLFVGFSRKNYGLA